MRRLTRRALLSSAAAGALLHAAPAPALPLFLGGGPPPVPPAPPASSIGTFTVVNNGGSTLTNQPLNMAFPTKLAAVNPATQHLAFDIAGVTVPATTGFFGQWYDGSQSLALVALTPASLPVGPTTINVTVQSGAASSTLPGGKTVAQIKTAILAHFDGLSGRPAGNDIVIALANLITWDNIAQGSKSWTAKLSDAIAAADCAVTYQGPTYIEFRSRANFIKDNVGGATHPFLQADWYFGAHLDTSGNILAVRFAPKMFNGTTQTGVTQTEYWYDCILQDGAGNPLITFKKSVTFTDADITSFAGQLRLIHAVGHGFNIADAVNLTTSGTLPSPLVAHPGLAPWITNFATVPYTVSNLGGPYYISPVDADHFVIMDRANLAQDSNFDAYILTPGGGGTHSVNRTIYHYRGSAWRVVDSRGNWTWSQNSPVTGTQNPVDIIHDPNYLIRTGLVPPYDLTLGCTMQDPDSPAVGWYSFWDHYAPSGIGGRTTAAIDNTGDHGCLGIHPRWVANWMQTKSTKWLDICRVMAVTYDACSQQWRDTATKTVPNVFSTAISGMTSAPSLTNGSFTLNVPTSGGVALNKGFVGVRTGNDASHLGDMTSFIYWLEGDRGVLDSGLYQFLGPLYFMQPGLESVNYYQQIFNRTKQVNGTNFECVYPALWGNYRQVGWVLRSLAHLLLSMPPGEVEFPYLKKHSTISGAYHNTRIQAHGPTYRTQGAFRDCVADFNSGLNGGCEDDQFFHQYCYFGVHMIAKADPSADWVAVLNHIAARYQAVGGPGNPQISLFGGGVIDDVANSKGFNATTDPVDGWASDASKKYSANAAGFNWSSVSPAGALQAFQPVSMTFQNDGSTVAVDGLLDLAQGLNPPHVLTTIEPLSANSRFRFPGGQFNNPDSGTALLPAGVSYAPTEYRFIPSSINLTTRTAQISLDGVTPVTWSLASNGVRPNTVWQYGTMGIFSDFNEGYTYIARALYGLAKADGLTGFDLGWADFVAYQRSQPSPAQSFAADPRWYFRAIR